MLSRTPGQRGHSDHRRGGCQVHLIHCLVGRSGGQEEAGDVAGIVGHRLLSLDAPSGGAAVQTQGLENCAGRVLAENDKEKGAERPSSPSVSAGMERTGERAEQGGMREEGYMRREEDGEKEKVYLEQAAPNDGQGEGRRKAAVDLAAAKGVSEKFGCTIFLGLSPSARV